MTAIRIKYLTVLMIVATGALPAQTDSLNHYLKMAALNNPGVKAEFTAYQASLQKIPQAGAYRDPELEMGFFLEPMNIVGGKQAAVFKLMQMFPWFGTKKAAQTEAAHMAGMSFEKFREARDYLYLEVYSQWFRLCSLQQKLMNNRNHKTLLAQLEQLALRKYSSAGSGYSVSAPPLPSGAPAAAGGSSSMSSMPSMSAGDSRVSAQNADMTGSSGGNMPANMGAASGGMADVLRIRIEMAELDNNIESILSETTAEKAKFNALLNRSAESEVHIPDTVEQISFVFDTKTVMAKIDDHNPMLGMIHEEGLAWQAKAEMDKKMGYPMFGVGIQYMLNGKTNDPMFGMGDMNGKDMIMPMIAVSIPVYRNKYRAQQHESRLWQQASEEKYASARHELEAELYKAKHLLDDAFRKIALCKKQAGLAETTYSLAVQEFIAGKTDLANVIQIQRQLLDYRLKQAEAVAGYNIMAGSVQKLISFNDIEQTINNISYGNE